MSCPFSFILLIKNNNYIKTLWVINKMRNFSFPKNTSLGPI